MTFNNCAEAYDAGHANIPASSPLYRKKLDRDGDGTACDNPPPGFKPKPGDAPEPAPGATTAQPSTSDQLPQTGPGEVGVVGALILAAGAAAVVAARRRRRRFQA